MLYPVGVIHGRFQPLHLGHIEYLIEGMKRVQFMYVGITNPDPSLTKPDSTDPHRSTLEANPCTFYERYLMIQTAFLEYGYKVEQFCIVPFPINYPELWHYYAPDDAVYFISIYDEWGEEKLRRFQSKGLKTEIIRRESSDNKGIAGSEVRRRIRDMEDWENLVSRATFKIVENFGIHTRIQQLVSSEKSSEWKIEES